MKFVKSIKPLSGFLVGAALLAASTTGAQACNGSYYVQYISAWTASYVYLRELVVNGSGNDYIGFASINDDINGGDNDNYVFQFLLNAYINGTKVLIDTNDTDCTISTAFEDLGTINWVNSAE